jgi:hypothetical protein
MALGFSILGIFVAIASGVVAAAMGASALWILFAYAGCGAAVLFAGLISAMVFEPEDQLHEDPMLVPGK